MNIAGASYLESFAISSSRGVQALIESLLGNSGIALDVKFLGITVAQWCTSLVFLIAVLALNLILVAGIRRRLKKHQTGDHWVPQILRALSSPLALAIWVYGIYFIIVPLLVPPTEEVPESSVMPIVVEQFLNLGLFIACIWFFIRLTRILDERLARAASRSNSKMDDILAPLLGQTLRVVIPALAVLFAIPLMELPRSLELVVDRSSSVVIIAMITWLLIQAVHYGEKLILARYSLDVPNNLEARKVYTQVYVLKRAILVVIGILAVASVLMLFEQVRQLGASILASAGVLGIIIGFAAQKTISNLFAGLQVALTQPIRLQDAVIVEGEFGFIEEINLTYVVVRVWDLRRLIVPINLLHREIIPELDPRFGRPPGRCALLCRLLGAGGGAAPGAQAHRGSLAQMG